MHPHQYALAAGTLWLATLIVLPYLFAKARIRAYKEGFADGKLAHQQTLKLQLQEAKRVRESLRVELEDAQRNCAQQLDARTASITALKAHIADLEARIMSYTAMPVTRADYDLMINAAETLALAEKTWKVAKGTEPWRNRALQQRQDIHALAVRVHHQLRSTPATTATAGEGA